MAQLPVKSRVPNHKSIHVFRTVRPQPTHDGEQVIDVAAKCLVHNYERADVVAKKQDMCFECLHHVDNVAFVVDVRVGWFAFELVKRPHDWYVWQVIFKVAFLEQKHRQVRG